MYSTPALFCFKYSSIRSKQVLVAAVNIQMLQYQSMALKNRLRWGLMINPFSSSQQISVRSKSISKYFFPFEVLNEYIFQGSSALGKGLTYFFFSPFFSTFPSLIMHSFPEWQWSFVLSTHRTCLGSDMSSSSEQHTFSMIFLMYIIFIQSIPLSQILYTFLKSIDLNSIYSSRAGSSFSYIRTGVGLTVLVSIETVEPKKELRGICQNERILLSGNHNGRCSSEVNVPGVVKIIKEYKSIVFIINCKLTMDRLVRLFQTPCRQFRYLHPRELPDGLLAQYSNQVFWTPRYQKIPYTEDLLKYIKYLQRSDKVNYSKMRQFVGHLLTDYHAVMLQDRPELNITIDKDVYIPKNGACAYHGKVDWVYSINGHNMTPVLFFQHAFNPVSGIAMALSNMYIRKSMKAKLEKQFPDELKNNYSHANTYGHNNVWGYSIMTTGHTWQVVRIDKNYMLEKSVILESNNKYRSMIHDEEMVSVLLGLFDYCLEMPEMNRKVLEKSYQYIDEQRWMIPGDSEDEYKKAPWVSKWLHKYYKNRL